MKYKPQKRTNVLRLEHCFDVEMGECWRVNRLHILVQAINSSAFVKRVLHITQLLNHIFLSEFVAICHSQIAMYRRHLKYLCCKYTLWRMLCFVHCIISCILFYSIQWTWSYRLRLPLWNTLQFVHSSNFLRVDYSIGIPDYHVKTISCSNSRSVIGYTCGCDIFHFVHYITFCLYEYIILQTAHDFNIKWCHSLTHIEL